MAEPAPVKKWPMFVAVMDGRKADIYCRDAREDALQPIEHLDIADPSSHERDFVSDDGGRSFDSAGQGRHRMEPKTSAKRHAQQEFVADIAARLQQSLDAHRFESLAIVAPPRTLGALRSSMNAPLQSRVICEIAKDLTAAEPAEIGERVNDEVKRLHGPLAHLG